MRSSSTWQKSAWGSACRMPAEEIQAFGWTLGSTIRRLPEQHRRLGGSPPVDRLPNT